MSDVRRRTLRIVGTGNHHDTKVFDADTGEDIGAQLGVAKIEWRVGDSENYPKPRLVLELLCDVVMEIGIKPRASTIDGSAIAKLLDDDGA